MYMSKDDMMSELGLAGEKVVTNMLNRMHRGSIIEHSINKFDSEKDMTMDGKKIEVKTESPYVLKDCFSFRPNQLKKCRNVDMLFIVSVPHVRYKHYSDGWVYKVNPEKFHTIDYTTKKGVHMVGIPIKQDSVVPIYKMSSEEIKELMKYSNTDYR